MSIPRSRPRPLCDEDAEELEHLRRLAFLPEKHAFHEVRASVDSAIDELYPMTATVRRISREGLGPLTLVSSYQRPPDRKPPLHRPHYRRPNT